MIRRFYIMPLRYGVDDAKVEEFRKVFDDTDRFLPGLVDSAAGLDYDSDTVIWENNFVDEAAYTGPYMLHAYHAQMLDNYLMADSPECITHDIYATRYTFDTPPPRIESGIRRIVLMKVAEGSDTSAIADMVAKGDGMAASTIGEDNVGWVSFKGRPWTHIWEQTFADETQLDTWLRSRDGLATSSSEAFARLGLPLEKLKIFTYDFTLKSDAAPAPMPEEPFPTFLTCTMRVAVGDADAFIAAMVADYDPFMADNGAPLTQRLRTVDDTGDYADILSSWSLPSIAAFNPIRFATYPDARWTRFVQEAMPMVVGGTRRFYRTA